MQDFENPLDMAKSPGLRAVPVSVTLASGAFLPFSTETFALSSTASDLRKVSEKQ